MNVVFDKSGYMGEQYPCEDDLRKLNTDNSSKGSHRLSRGGREQSLATTAARQYANDIEAHAETSSAHSLYPGRNFGTLARFLQLPYQETNYAYGVTAGWDDGDEYFTSIYNLSSNSPSLAIQIKDPAAFEKFVEQESNEGSSLLLFLRGYPSPPWINSIGAACGVDPEFWRQHLDFWSTAGQEYIFPLPSLPSSSSNIVKLHLNTIGLRYDGGGGSRQDRINMLRKESGERMADYLHNLRRSRTFKTGDSIVRHINIHHEKHFSIEQDVSMCFNRVARGWVTIVWLDIGNDLRVNPGSELLEPVSPSANFHPVFRHKPHTTWSSESRTKSPARQAVRNAPVQSASLLHSQYGTVLNHEVAASDPFYALREIYDFGAWSQKILLNAMETNIKAELESLQSAGEIPSLSNLIHLRQCLDRQIEKLKETMTTIKAKGIHEPAFEDNEAWPRAEKESHRKISRLSAMKLLMDHEAILQQAHDLSKQCKHIMNMSMNIAMIAESKRAIKQAQGVEKMTRIATFYLPLSFATGFFGMNMKELGNGTSSMWIFFAVAGVMLPVSISLIYCDIIGFVVTGVRKATKWMLELSRQMLVPLVEGVTRLSEGAQPGT